MPHLLPILADGTAGFEVALAGLAARGPGDLDAVAPAVREILASVRAEGDAAVRRAIERFEHRTAGSLLRGVGDGAAALSRLPAPVQEGLRLAADRIERFHRRQWDAELARASFSYEEEGITLGMRVRPLGRVGVYAPGGKARYPSSVLMTAIPARVAGVKDIVLATPAPDDSLLAAAHLAGVSSILDAGGAQAIAALAYGTASVRRVDKILGPGNAYVACAKRLVFGDVAIDSIAGPSEILVLADAAADAALCAADLLSQAEHDEAAYAVLVTTSASLAAAVAAEVDAQLASLARRAIAEASVRAHGRILVVPTLDRLVEVAEVIAAEHVAFHLAEPEAVLARLASVGAALLGASTPVALGDYLAGPSHVLPTGGCVRFGSPLGVHDFVARTSILQYAPAALTRQGPVVAALARAEGLDAHALAVEVRLERAPGASAAPGRYPLAIGSQAPNAGGTAWGRPLKSSEMIHFSSLARIVASQPGSIASGHFGVRQPTHGLRGVGPQPALGELSVGVCTEEPPMARMWTRALLLGALGLAGGSVVGCAQERAPINQVQADALAKSFFVGPNLADMSTSPEFYMRGTIIDVGYGAAQDGLFTSTYAQPLSRIRWEITENYLNARLSYERIADTDGKGDLTTNGGLVKKTTNDGQIVASYKISSHFDIRRSYNPTTGEELNVVVENTTDRVWYQREYFRVDWSQNLAADSYDFDTLSSLGWIGGIQYDALAFTVLDPNDPNAPHWDAENGYFDVTVKAFAKPAEIDLSSLGWGINQIPACMLPGEFAGGSAPYGDCNPIEITLRQSFRKVVDDDYVPLDYDGTRFNAFGAFTTERAGYARNYGMTDAQWFRFASRYNIWDRSHFYNDPASMSGATPCATFATTEQPTSNPNADPNRDTSGSGTADECGAVTDATGQGGSQCDIFTKKCTLPFRARTPVTIPWYMNGSTTTTVTSLQAQIAAAPDPSHDHERSRSSSPPPRSRARTSSRPPTGPCRSGTSP